METNWEKYYKENLYHGKELIEDIKRLETIAKTILSADSDGHDPDDKLKAQKFLDILKSWPEPPMYITPMYHNPVNEKVGVDSFSAYLRHYVYIPDYGLSAKKYTELGLSAPLKELDAAEMKKYQELDEKIQLLESAAYKIDRYYGGHQANIHVPNPFSPGGDESGLNFRIENPFSEAFKAGKVDEMSLKASNFFKAMSDMRQERIDLDGSPSNRLRNPQYREQLDRMKDTALEFEKYLASKEKKGRFEMTQDFKHFKEIATATVAFLKSTQNMHSLEKLEPAKMQEYQKLAKKIDLLRSAAQKLDVDYYPYIDSPSTICNTDKKIREFLILTEWITTSAKNAGCLHRDLQDPKYRGFLDSMKDATFEFEKYLTLQSKKTKASFGSSEDFKKFKEIATSTLAEIKSIQDTVELDDQKEKTSSSAGPKPP